MSLLGSCLTCFLLHRLVSDWNTYPMYTTVDNSAADINSVLFPTIMVCQGDGHPTPSGGWAYVKKVLDLYRIGSLDNQTVVFTELGRIFEDYITFAGTNFLDSYLEYLQSKQDQPEFLDEQVEMIVKDSENNLEKEYDEFIDVGERTLLQNYTELSALKFVREAGIKSMFENSIVEYLKRNVLKSNCGSKEKDVLYCVYLMKTYLIPPYFVLVKDKVYTGLNDGYGLGTLLSVFSQLLESGSFMRSSSGSNAYATCGQMGPLENKLHDILAEMANQIGIGHVSLFELPALLESHGKPMSSEKTWVDTYPHTSCKHLSKSELPYFSQIPCDVQWGEFILKGTNNEFLANTLETDKSNRTHPCQQINGKCCPLRHLTTTDQMYKVMSLMKYSTRRGRSSFDIKQLLGILENSSYADVEQRERISHEKIYPDTESFMPYCQIKRGGNRLMVTSYGLHFYYPTCDFVTPAVTNKGICYGFNAIHPANLLNESPFQQAMRGAFKSDLSGHKLHNAFSGENGHGYEFYLDKQRVLSPEQFGHSVTDGGHFSVSINNLINSFNAKSHVTRVRTGFQTEIEVTVREITISEGVNTTDKQY